MRLPIALSPGQFRLAIDRETIAIGAASGPSLSVKGRPSISGMPTVAKYAGLIDSKLALGFRA